MQNTARIILFCGISHKQSWIFIDLFTAITVNDKMTKPAKTFDTLIGQTGQTIIGGK